MASKPARIRAKQLDPRPPSIETSSARAKVEPGDFARDPQTGAELRRAFRLTDQQCAIPDPVPASHYSNQFVPFKPLNSFLLWLTQFQSLLFLNLAQTPIQSRATQRERSLYNQLVGRHKWQRRRRQEENRRDFNLAEAQTQMEGPNDHLSELYWPEHSNLGVIVVFLIEFVAFLRNFLIVYKLSAFSPKSIRLSVSKSLNSIDQLIYTLNPLPLDRVLYELNGNRSIVQSSSRMPAGLGSEPHECLRGLVDFFNQRYEKFLFWNSSDGLREYGEFVNEFLFLEQSTSVQMFREEVILFIYIMTSLVIGCGLTGSIVTYFMPYDVFPLLFIYNPTYCAFHIKMRLQQHLNDARQSYINYWSIFRLNPDFSLSTRSDSTPSSSSLSSSAPAPAPAPASASGSLQPLTSSSLPSMLLPSANSTSSSGLVRSRARTFLTSGQRASFIVHPRNRSLQKLVRMAPLPESRVARGALEAAASSSTPSNANRHTQNQTTAATRSNRFVAKRMQRIIQQVPSLSDELYRDFIPDARSQALRRVFTLLSPTLSAWATFWLSISLVLIYVIFTGFNTTTVNLNREFALFFERSPQWNAAATAAHAAHPLEAGQRAPMESSCLEEGRSLELVRVSMAIYLAEQLERLSGKTGLRQLQERADQSIQRVAKAVAPTTNPDFYEWTLPEGVSILASVLIILYLNIFFVCISELCFWLFALRLKLTICHLLLRYYSDTFYLEQESRDLNNRGRHSRHPQTTSIELHDRLIDLILMGSNHFGEHIQVPNEVLNIDNEQTPTCSLNLGAYQVIKWAFLSTRRRELMCYQYTKRLIMADYEAAKTDGGASRAENSSSNSSTNGQSGGQTTRERLANKKLWLGNSGKPSDAFLMSAYLEFRLFLEQIDACRRSINVITTYWTIHSINILASSMFTHRARSKFGFLMAGYLLVNMGLITASIFQSQCSKMVAPIYSMLASSSRVNKTTWHLAILWQRSLTDLLGPRSKFFFKVVSIRISYASALQFNFGITSLYLLTVDRFRYFQMK